MGIRYSCDYCYKDISSIVRIQCAECGLLPENKEGTGGGIKANTSATSSLEEVDLCVECFAAGVEFSSHKKTHSYRVLKPLDFAVYREDWRADEEMLLLEAIESNGLGNWHDVAEQLSTRTAEECKEHYIEVYLEDGGTKVLSAEQIKLSMFGLRGQKIKRPKLSTSEENIAKAPTPQSVPANHEISGFMPLRGEFETEFENEAEVAIKDLAFTEEDSAEDLQLKFAMLDIYSAVLDKRASRHAFIFSHGLVNFKMHQATDKARGKEEKEIYTLLKPFARFIASEDFQTLLEGLVREEELKRQIAHLQELRRNGLRSFDEFPAFENERKHLELYLKGGTSLGGGASLLAPPLKTTIKEPHPIPTVTSLIKVTIKPTHDSASSTTAPSSAVPSVSATPVSVHEEASTPLTSSLNTTPITHIANLSNIQTGVIAAPSGGRKASTPLNISHSEGVELLSEKERHLCSILRLYPRLYLSIKDTLIREYLKLGGLKRAQARAAVKIDVNKTSKLYDFFVAAGWIKPPASGE